MKTVKSVMVVVCIILLGLPGCAQYTVKSLTPLTRGITPNASTQPSLSFAHRVFTKGECKKYLDRDVIGAGYQPVQITIDNNSKHSFMMTTADFSFPCATVEEVAQHVHTNTEGRIAAYGVGSLLFFPLIIPAIVDGIGSQNANEQLDRDYANKSFDRLFIKPYSSTTGIVFVALENFTENFYFNLTNQVTGDLYTLATNEPYIAL